MKSLARRSMLVAAIAAAVAWVPESAEAGRGRRASRSTVRDHRSTVRRPHVHRPHVHVHHGYGYYPYYGHPYYYDHGYYYGPPGYAVVYAPPPPPPRRVIALAVHLGSIAQSDDTAVGAAGVALRLRGRIFEGELELGRRYYEDETSERSIAATIYANLGRRDAFHPYLLAGLGALESERGFGQVGAGLAIPVASRLTLTADVRLASIDDGDDDGDVRASGVVIDDGDDDGLSTLEGRLSLVLDF